MHSYHMAAAAPGGSLRCLCSCHCERTHEERRRKTRRKGYLRSLGPDDDLRSAAPIGWSRRRRRFSFARKCHQHFRAKQEAASVSRTSKETKTRRSSAPNYTVLSKRQSAIACGRTSSTLVVQRMSCIFSPPLSSEFVAEGKKGTPSGDSFVVSLCDIFQMRPPACPAPPPAVPFHSHALPAPQAHSCHLLGVTFEGADVHIYARKEHNV